MTQPLSYPPTRRESLVETLHGVPVADPYRWLEDDHSAETTAWVAAQNALTDAYLEAIPARTRLHQRMTELWDYEKFDVPFQKGGRIFFTRNDGLQNQSVLYWLERLDGVPRLLLDPNTLSEDGTVALSGLSVSEDGQYLAYSLSGAGSDWQEWRVRRVADGSDLPDCVQWSKFSGASWTNDNQGFFYSRYDAPEQDAAFKSANYYQKLYYHRLGEPQTGDRLVYQRADQPEWGFGGQVSDDGRYLVIEVWHGTHPENAIFYLDLSRPGAEVVELLPDFDASYTFVGNEGERFFLHTNLDALRYRVVAVDVTQPARALWTEFIPEGADTLETAHLTGDRFFAIYLQDAKHQVQAFALDGRALGAVDLPGLGTVVGFGGGRQDRQTFYLFTSFTTPGEIYHYDLESASSSRFRRPALRFNPGDYVTEQVFFPSKDGARIPMFLTYKKGLARDGRNPTFLYGYGGFNIALSPAFNPAHLAWMEQGGLFAQPNLRGGGEYGKAWHDAGRLRNKQNVFDDFIAAAEWLIASGYTSRDRLAIHGRSNGGLLIGACLTQRPDLFGAAVATVGVLDMLRFHKWTIGWGWVSDYGSPDDPGDFAYLLGYSPYHNVRPGVTYPPTLVTTGDHDDRVFPAHSFKFAAALQAAQAGPAPVLIRIDTRAGHGAGKPTAKLIDEWADIYAFVMIAVMDEP
jgi:prolyl oligopeptidase